MEEQSERAAGARLGLGRDGRLGVQVQMQDVVGGFSGLVGRNIEARLKLWLEATWACRVDVWEGNDRSRGEAVEWQPAAGLTKSSRLAAVMCGCGPIVSIQGRRHGVA